MHSPAAKTGETLTHILGEVELGLPPQSMHTPLLPADGQVQEKEGEHGRALVVGTVRREVCHLLQLLQYLRCGRRDVSLLCATGKPVHTDTGQRATGAFSDHRELRSHRGRHLHRRGLVI